MAEPAPVQLQAGHLLVAAPALVDPNFDHSVVLLLDYDENGALGGESGPVREDVAHRHR